MSPMCNRQSTRKAFTLIEMLAVLGILMVLAALLLPSIRQPRELARRASCKSNLHQISVASMMYYGAHNHLPTRPVEVAKPSLTTLIEANLGGDRRQVGLGLLYPEYLTDGEAFYCPSGHIRGGREIMRSEYARVRGGRYSKLSAASANKSVAYAAPQAKGLAKAAGGQGGSSAAKITICHFPPGNPGNCQTISVPFSALSGHLAHGDTIGDCPDGCGQGGDDDDDDDDDDDETWTPSVIGSYMYRGMTAMPGFASPLSGRLTEGIVQAAVMDDNTGDLQRIIGVRATGGASFYKHDRKGCNILYVDGSARWLDDPFLQTYIPTGALADPAQYGRIWQLADERQRR